MQPYDIKIGNENFRIATFSNKCCLRRANSRNALSFSWHVSFKSLSNFCNNSSTSSFLGEVVVESAFWEKKNDRQDEDDYDTNSKDLCNRINKRSVVAWAVRIADIIAFSLN
jgi:hypothetical protein